MGVPDIVPWLVWSCVNRSKWQGSRWTSERNSDQRHLYMQPVSVLCICVCMCVHNEMTDIDLSGVVSSERPCCIWQPVFAQHKPWKACSPAPSLTEHFILAGPETTICTHKTQLWHFKERLGRNHSASTNWTSVTCEWWTNSQVKVLWVKDTLILDTSWANKEREKKERGRVKEKKAEGVEFKTASLLSKSCLWKFLEHKETGQSKCLSRKSKLWSIFADYCSRWHCMRALLAGLLPCSSIPR